MIKLLINLMDQELEKPFEEQDWEWIEECAQYLEQITEGKYNPDPVLRKEQIKQLQEAAQRTVARSSRKGHRGKDAVLWRKAVPACIAAILLLFLCGIAFWRLPGGQEGIEEKDREQYYASLQELLVSEEVTALNPVLLSSGTGKGKEDIGYLETEEGEKFPQESMGEMWESTGEASLQELVRTVIGYRYDTRSVEIRIYDENGELSQQFSSERDFRQIGGTEYSYREIGEGITVVYQKDGGIYIVPGEDREKLFEIIYGLEP